MIDLSAVTFGYPGKAAIFEGLTWKVQQGESWAIIGPSGCGKTTLLYLLAGLRQPLAGSVMVGGAAVLKPRRETGLILQDYGLLPWGTVAENAGLGLRIRGVALADERRLVDRWLDRLGISAIAPQYPGQISGGQRQRTAIARTLALEPDLLLMDEPFSSLDALTRVGLQDLVVDLGLEGSLTVVLVTHSIEEAVFLGRKIMVLPSPPIRTIQVLENPAAGEIGYRRQEAFYQQCSAVRRAVEAVMGGEARGDGAGPASGGPGGAGHE
jgi:ABC-type nitrate/sulfonate/bicarbonate transport system ATPase subunit